MKHEIFSALVLSCMISIYLFIIYSTYSKYAAKAGLKNQLSYIYNDLMKSKTDAMYLHNIVAITTVPNVYDPVIEENNKNVLIRGFLIFVLPAVILLITLPFVMKRLSMDYKRIYLSSFIILLFAVAVEFTFANVIIQNSITFDYPDILNHFNNDVYNYCNVDNTK